jgi:hypothetical protein
MLVSGRHIDCYPYEPRCLSHPRSGLSALYMRCTWAPRPWKMPANSTAMYLRMHAAEKNEHGYMRQTLVEQPTG